MENEDTQKNNKILDKIKKLTKPITDENKCKLVQKEKEKFLLKTTKFPNKVNHYNELLINNTEKINKLLIHPYNSGKIKQLNKQVNKQIKVQKILINTNKEQTSTFKQWAGAYRYMYNKILYLYNNKKEKLNFIKLRNKYTPKDRISDTENWLLKIPKEIRAAAIQELCTTVSENMAKVKTGKLKQFTIKYKKKKDEKSFTVPHSALKLTNNNLCLYKNILKKNCNLKINKRETVKKIEFDCKIKLTKTNLCYISIPYTFTGICFNENQIKDIISLDPGIRTFLTGYSPNGHIIEIGKHAIQKIIRVCLVLDKMQSIIDPNKKNKIKCKKRLKIIKKMNKLRIKIQNLKNDMHWKVANFLCKNYSTILIPTTKISNIILKKNRKLRSSSVRALINLSHYSFRQKLLSKSKDYDCLVIECNEAYTSKTCTNCGFLHEQLGGNKIFKCPSCNLKIERDIGGSRNILLRNSILREDL